MRVGQLQEPPDISARVLTALIAAEKSSNRRQLLLRDLVSKTAALQEAARLEYLLRATAAEVPEQVAAILEHRHHSDERRLRSANVAIVTIKQPELRAAKMVFGVRGTARENLNVNGLRFWETRLSGGDPRREFSVVLMMVGEGRNVPCAIACERLFANYHVDVCFLIGMAAGVKGKVNIGDVVAAEMVLDYEHQRKEPRSTRKRPDPHPLENPWKRHLLNFEPNAEEWHRNVARLKGKLQRKYLPRNLHGRFQPSYQTGVILAGENLLADGRLPAMREEYHDLVRAAEMEGAGFCRSCKEHDVPWYVFRGIADYGTPQKKKDWQTLATLAAATAAREFLLTDYRQADEIEF